MPLTVVQQEDVDATLGDEAVVNSVQAGLIAIFVVMAFMILYYRLPGVLAALALFVYVSVTLAVFKLWPVTITSAGMAAFVLSVGMAVDANILIFERMKEELRLGRSLRRRHRRRLQPRLDLDPRQQRLDADHLRHPLLVRRPVRRQPGQGLRADAGPRRGRQHVLGDHGDAHLPAGAHRHAA